MCFHHVETSQHPTNHLKCLPPSPTPHHNYSNSTALFLQEFTTLLSIAATTPHEWLVTGDFNIYVDNQSIAFTREFLTLLLSTNLTQHVNFPTHYQYTTHLILSLHHLSLICRLKYLSLLTHHLITTPFSHSLTYFLLYSIR